MSKSLILAIDVGTSSVRAMIFDQHGVGLNASETVFAQEYYQAETTPDGGSTLDPEAMLDRIFRCIDTALQQAGPDASQIGLVAMDTLVSNLLGVDSRGQALTPIYTWADTRGSDLALDWKNRLAVKGLSPQDYTQRTGCRLHTSYWPIRLLWIRSQAQPHGEVAHWLSLGEYMLYRLFGTRRVSYSTASWNGLFNRHALDWDADVLAALNLYPDQLSTPSALPVQGFGGDWAKRWPQLSNIPWLPSIADGVASNIGAGCTSPRYIALSVGTSGALRIVIPGAPEKVPDGLFAYRVDQARSLVGGALSNAGNLYAWMERTLKLPDAKTLESSVANMEPDSHGLTILPFLAGERAPGWNPDAQAAFLGMTLNTTPEQLVRAGLESIAYRFRQVADRLSSLLPPDAAFVANGAAILNSPCWMQIVADVLNATVYAATEREATIRGTVYLATSNEPPPKLGQAYRPDPARHATYNRAVARQQALYDRLLGR